jgi:lysozyme family protein
MKTVRELAAEIVAREGGFVDDPDDPGGATNHGVTIHSLRRLGIDITGDGRVDVLDVRRLSRARAIEIYIDHYFRRPGIGALPEVLQPSVFDMYVNAGANAVKILQRLCSQMGFSSVDDGVIGPQTIRAAAQKAGTQTLRDSAMVQVLSGVTSIEEMVRVTKSQNDV